MALLFGVSEVHASSSYWTSAGCADCHVGQNTTYDCGMCHAHGTHSSSAKTDINVVGVTNKSSYAPGETVSVTISGGYRPTGATHSARALLLDNNGVQLAISTGATAGGIAPVNAPRWPVTLTAPAPTTPGTYNWSVAWYGNVYDSGSASFGTGWTDDLDNPDHGRQTVAIPSFTVAGAAVTHANGQIDFDGDGKTDPSVWRSSNSTWYTVGSSGAIRQVTWGLSGDVPVPGFYDNDALMDHAVYRPSTANWFIRRSSDGGVTQMQWGVAGDTAVPGDYDGDGKTDYAVWRPSSRVWFVQRSSDGGVTQYSWGLVGDTPVPGDYDGDGKTDFAVFRPSDHTWYILRSSDNVDVKIQWGINGDILVPGDYDGDKKADIAVYRPSNGNWYIIRSSDGGITQMQWGMAGDTPVPGDYDGDGKTDAAVYRPSSGVWFIVQSSNGAVVQQSWGVSGDVPLTSKY